MAKNPLKQDFKAVKPNQKWGTNITQYRMGDCWLYLSAIKDLFNNEIIAFQISNRNDNELVLQTFRQAWKQQEDVTDLTVHSDQGFQYTSHACHDMMPKVSARISMSCRGNCYDNTSMEGFSRISKRKSSTHMLSKYGLGTKENRRIYAILQPKSTTKKVK
ncbi:hypothetical protein BJH92_06000 [Paenibacillus polymyxa]|nr:hypothetical protein BJH92_06000 [Paenibacillus polymyxa]KAF6584726.1 DDE-type integrase/transposase/recombinase [Paenibacillus sp. EKM211P]